MITIILWIAGAIFLLSSLSAALVIALSLGLIHELRTAPLIDKRPFVTVLASRQLQR